MKRVTRAERLVKVGLYELEKVLGKGNFALGLAFKGVIALLLKPIETLAEKFLLKRALKDAESKSMGDKKLAQAT